MNVIVCVDDRFGMLFNKRRQSQDKVLRERILQICGERQLWMNAYSYSLFSEMENGFLCVEEDFLSRAGKEDFCFVENCSLKLYETKIEQLVLFRWNKKYPADFYFDLNLECWEKICEREFQGSSHDKITEEVYNKRR